VCPNDVPVFEAWFDTVVVQGSGANQEGIARLDDDFAAVETESAFPIDGVF
jgi:hypothetical protein